MGYYVVMLIEAIEKKAISTMGFVLQSLLPCRIFIIGPKESSFTIK